MIAQIAKALSSGFTSKQVIDYILKKFPNHSDKIKNAMTAGFTTDQILKFLSGGRKALASIESNEKEGATEFQQTRNRDIGRREKINERGAQAGALLGTSIAAPMAASALKHALPTNLSSMIPALTGQSPQQTQQTQSSQPPNSPVNPAPANIPQPPVNQSAPIVAQPSNIQQSKGISNPKEYLEKKGVLQAVNESLKRGNNPEQVAAELGIKRSGNTKIDPELLQNIEEYAKTAQEQPQERTAMEPSSQKPDEVQPKAETPKIEKNSVVSSPQGVGEVKEIRNGQAIVDVDGKLHKVKEEELESEPEEVKQATLGFDPATVSDDLRSAPLNEVYLPTDRRHVTVKYNAGLKPVRYLYYRKDGQPIPDDYVSKIIEGLQLPVSSGKSFWGTWSADQSDSRGAANYDELVKNAQEEGKPDDPSKLYWFVKEEAIYEHPYMEKAGKEELRRGEKEFNEANKKPKKKRA